MNKFWTTLLEKAIQHLLYYEWQTLLREVTELMMVTDLTGDEKRERVINVIKRTGYSGATWLLRAGVEVAYGTLQTRK